MPEFRIDFMDRTEGEDEEGHEFLAPEPGLNTIADAVTRFLELFNVEEADITRVTRIA